MRIHTDRAFEAMRTSTVALCLSLVIASTSGSALAQDSEAEGGIQLRLGAGVNTKPDYLGSDDYEVGFFPIIGVERDRPGPGLLPPGFSIGPSIGIIGSRDADDNAALTGLSDIDFGVELGAKVEYETNLTRAFVAVRGGVSGHNGIVADFGVDVITRPTERLTLSGGPRMTLATDDYFDTYFGITPAEASASAFSPYDPGGGVKSIGLQGEAIFDVTERTSLHLRAGWDHLVGDAADSPIVAGAGDENQFTVGVGVSRTFQLNLWGN